jgi:periplasmic protein TonB
MSAVLPYQPGTVDTASASWLQAKRFATFAPIVLLHVGFIYVLQNGMAQRVAKLPTAVFATLIQSETARPAPPPAPLKSLSLPKLTMPVITPAIVPDIVITNTTASTAPARESSSIAAPAAPTQPAVAAPSQPKTISTVEYLQAPQPEYPSMSRCMGEQGKVLLRILVNEKGRAEHIDIQRSSGFPRLDEAARAAALRALFKPYVEDGKAMAVYVVVPIGFQLD